MWHYVLLWWSHIQWLFMAHDQNVFITIWFWTLYLFVLMLFIFNLLGIIYKSNKMLRISLSVLSNNRFHNLSLSIIISIRNFCLHISQTDWAFSFLAWTLTALSSSVVTIIDSPLFWKFYILGTILIGWLLDWHVPVAMLSVGSKPLWKLKTN